METKYMRMSAGKDYQVKADQLVNIVQDIAETAIQYGMSIETDKEAEESISGHNVCPRNRVQHTC